MLTIKLAIKNLLGAGLRTWLNVAVLSFAFVVMVFYNGMLDGWNRQAIGDTIQWEIGGGQLWHPEYDRFDPLSLQDAHAPLDGAVKDLAEIGRLAPILMVQASAYPNGRMTNILLKGIDPKQTILALPAGQLAGDTSVIRAIIGKRMARSARLKKGDAVLVRWRDRYGAFDAREVTIAGIFDSNVPAIDNNQLWIPLDQLQRMTGLPGEATILVGGQKFPGGVFPGWLHQDQQRLLEEFEQMMRAKKTGSSVLSGLLLAIALLAVFDTQVLSIFRRQREIGTYIALGMTRLQVVKLFTAEGGVHSLLALAVAFLYGAPFLAFLSRSGIPIPQAADDMGISITNKIIPVYSLGMVLFSMLLVVIATIIVSYLPARRIAHMKPTDALKGKVK